MEKLSQKLKSALISYLRNKTHPDASYAYTGGKLYTANQLAQEIEDETKVGINTITAILELSLDKLYKK